MRNLACAGHIAKGYVDTRSIKDLCPDDVRDVTQFHAFAGIGVWSYALRAAGWPDDRPVWTGSCPCQPFSGAGKGAGFADPRHLWPDWFRLIDAERPQFIFGEQVASPDGYAWLDLVQTDLESASYTVGAVISPAAGYGAPHGRHRIYFVAHAANPGRERWRSIETSARPGAPRGKSERFRDAGELGNPACERYRAGDMEPITGWRELAIGQTDSPYADLEWLPCTDGKWRPTEPGLFPLAHGVANRVAQLRAYGNAICAPQAIEFVRVFMEHERD